jgi:predicted  nucleic acid-binding Zn-ribbon protein
MAESKCGMTAMLDRMTVIAEAVVRLQKGQATLQSTLESKLDKFRNEFMANIEVKFKAMKSDIDLELATHSKDIESLSQSVDSIIRRIEKVEHAFTADRPMHIADNVNTESILSDPDLAIIATNVKFEHDEDILAKARELVNHLDVDADVVVLLG